MYSAEQIAGWLAQVLDPGQLVELRTLHLPGRNAVTEYFPGDQLERLAGRALELEEQGAKGVYFVLNPVRPELAGTGASARDADVLCRRWLLIDVDPIRPADTSATDEEHDTAWKVADEVRKTLLGAGLGASLVADSGNGWHLLLPVSLPNDEASKALCKALLHALAAECNTATARVDTSTYNASRICRLYGTLSRKGEDAARPHRRSCLHSYLDCEPGQPADGNAIAGVLASWKRSQELHNGRAAGNGTAHARDRAAAYLKECPEAISGQKGHNRLFAAARAVVYGFDLGPEEGYRILDQVYNPTCVPPWSEAEIRHKCAEADTQPFDKPRGYLLHEANGHYSSNGASTKPAEEAAVPVIEAGDVCTMHDLARAGAEINWLWPGWLQRNVVNVIGAEAGTGKTRFTLDLVRRIAHGLPWPDGQPMQLDRHEKTVWVLADNHHDEMVTICRAWGIMDNVLAATTRDRPYEGTCLEELKDYTRLESIIKAARPLFVVIDTVGNSTSKKPHSSEDAQAYYLPLQVIARRYQILVLALTHLNTGGGMLGRRVVEKARSVLKITKPDPAQENRRRLALDKTNSKMPPPLGVTMGDAGNDYDLEPPESAEHGQFGRQPRAPRLDAVCGWLKKELQAGPKRLSVLVNLAAQAGFARNLLFRGKDSPQFEQFESEGKQWLRLVDETDVPRF